MYKYLFLLFLFLSSLNAHFLALLPSSDNIQSQKESQIKLDISFIHPFEQTGMNMKKPKLYLNTQSQNISLIPNEKFGKKSWLAHFDISTPKVYKFFVKPQAYFEKSEKKFISHVPKVIISAYGFEEGWNEPIGLKYEIVPMSKPFALYKGNLFQGQVLHNGKPKGNVEVEVELYNEFGLKAPNDSFITQVVKTDLNGIFSFVMNHKGWWGFAALIEEGTKKYSDKKEYVIENGALLWIKAY